MSEELTVGAVAYDAKVVTIWEGFRTWFRERGVPMTYVLYADYERQVVDLLAGRIDVAWNSPLAWVRARRLAEAAGRRALATVMRDTDQDLTSVVLVRDDGSVDGVADLAEKLVGTGAIDSPQSHLIPCNHLINQGVPPVAMMSQRFDVMMGKHGDHVGGERRAVEALLDGKVAAAAIIAGNQLAFAQEGLLPPGSVRVLTETAPYDHCTFTAIEGAGDAGLHRAFTDGLLGMSYEDPEVRGLLDLEGLREWRPGRTSGFAQLEEAVDVLHLYEPDGRLADPRYTP